MENSKLQRAAHVVHAFLIAAISPVLAFPKHGKLFFVEVHSTYGDSEDLFYLLFSQNLDYHNKLIIGQCYLFKNLAQYYMGQTEILGWYSANNCIIQSISTAAKTELLLRNEASVGQMIQDCIFNAPCMAASSFKHCAFFLSNPT